MEIRFLLQVSSILVVSIILVSIWKLRKVQMAEIGGFTPASSSATGQNATLGKIRETNDAKEERRSTSRSLERKKEAEDKSAAADNMDGVLDSGELEAQARLDKENTYR